MVFPADFMVILIGAIALILVVALLFFAFFRNKRRRSSGGDSFGDLFDQQPEAWLIMDGISLKTIRANQKAMNLFSIYRKQYLGKLSFNRIFEEDLSEDEVAILLNAIDHNTFVNKTLICRSLSGRNFKMTVSINRVGEGNLFCRFTEPLLHAIPVGNEGGNEVVSGDENKADDYHGSGWREAAIVNVTNENHSGLAEVPVPFTGFPMAAAREAIAVLNAEQKISESNDSFSMLTGYASEELKYLGFDQLIHPSQSREHENWFSRLLSGTNKVSRAERTILRKDGKQASLEILGAGIPEKGIVIITAIDNSEVKEAQRILQRSRENLMAFVENTGETVFSLDAMGKITVINSRYQELFLLNKSVWLSEGMSYEDQLLPEERMAFKERFRSVLQGKEVNYREDFTDSRGEIRVYEAFLYPVKDEDGLITGMTYSGRDITERLKQEEALRDARDKAEQATQAKSEFLAVMSHEIRTPLNGLIGISELLNNTELTGQQKEFVDIIRLSGEALLQVISDILDFSKIEANKMQLEIAPFHVDEAVKETITILSGKAREKGVALRMEREEGLPLYILGDKARLRQILMNLVGNSIKFTEQGSVIIQLANGGEKEGRNLIKFAVSDTGIGIEPAQAEQLFTAFTQADPSTYRKYGGTGLGLTICKTLVNLMGGDIWVESRMGEGSTFYFTIQADAVSDAAAEEVRMQEEVKQKIPLGDQHNDFALHYPARILLADDNDINRLLARKLFERLGYTIESVGDGREAYEQVKEKEFDIVFMDMQMPEWDGIQATKKIRSEADSMHQPVIIAMTAFAGKEDKDACKEAGMDDYISKPVTLDDIEQMLLKWTPDHVKTIKNRTLPMNNDLKPAQGDLIDLTAIRRLQNIGQQTDPGFLHQILEMFMKQAPENISDIIQCFDRGDFTGLWKAAHKLKGTCLNIGAERLAGICREIERKGKNLETNGLQGLCMQLEIDYKSTLTELKKLFEYN